LLENNSRRPLIIINPIFDSEINPHKIEQQNKIDNVPNTINQEHTRSFVNRRNNNISDKISIGFIL
jgi:hypothetical protein